MTNRRATCAPSFPFHRQNRLPLDSWNISPVGRERQCVAYIAQIEEKYATRDKITQSNAIEHIILVTGAHSMHSTFISWQCMRAVCSFFLFFYFMCSHVINIRILYKWEIWYEWQITRQKKNKESNTILTHVIPTRYSVAHFLLHMHEFITLIGSV